MKLKHSKNLPRKQKGGDSDDYDASAYAVKYGALTFIFIAICCIITYALTHQTSIYSNFGSYFFIVLFFLVMIFAISLDIGEDRDSTVLFFKISMVFIIIGLLVYVFASIGNMFPSSGPILTYTLYAMFGVVLLVIGYNYLMKYLSRLTGWYGFIAQLIFYIPCMLYDGLYWTLDQFKLTSILVYLLLGVEIMILLIYLYLPSLVTAAVTDSKNSTLLANNPILLNKGKQVLATADKLMKPNTSNEFRKNYAISMWVYLNSQNPAMAAYGKETEIFSYGYKTYSFRFVEPVSGKVHVLSPDKIESVLPDSTGKVWLTEKGGEKYQITKDVSQTDPVHIVKPMIRYYCGGGDGKDRPEERNKYIFYFSEYPPSKDVYDPSFNYPIGESQFESNSKTFYDIEIPNQKWNQIVINYNRNIVDVFINGNLERSFKMVDAAFPNYSELDSINVGDDNGLEGAICNVVYYHHPLNAQDVANSYNLFMGNNPPINRNIEDPYKAK